MTLAELKKLLVQLTQTYFAGATVTYAKQSFVAPSGGGSSEMTAHEGEYFTNAEINNRLVKEEDDT